jgi:hypothetical protein
MIALGQGVTSDAEMIAGHPYLGRIVKSNRYEVFYPYNSPGAMGNPICKDAVFYDPLAEEWRKVLDVFADMAPIY